MRYRSGWYASCVRMRRSHCESERAARAHGACGYAKRFLLQIMNDNTMAPALPIEAALGSLQHLRGRKLRPGRDDQVHTRPACLGRGRRAFGP